MDYYIICDNSYNERVRFSKAEWEELLSSVQDYFDLPRTNLHEELRRANLEGRELPKEEIDQIVTDEMAEWDKMPILDQYHPRRGQMAVVSGEGVKTWVEILKSSHFDEYFGGKEQRQDFITLWQKQGEFLISYKSEEQA
jgi:hypothetical protein